MQSTSFFEPDQFKVVLGPSLAGKRPKTEIKIRPDCLQVPRCLKIDLLGEVSLIYVAIFKPGPLGRLLGPSWAENLPKTEENYNIYIYIYIYT